MRIRRSGAAAVIALLIAGTALTSCSPQAAPPKPDATAGNPGSGSPELAALRERAGIEPCEPATEAAAPAVDGLPALTLPCLGAGHEVDLAGLRGEPMVLNLWASWCLPCRQELPLFQRLHDEAGTQLRMIGVDFADPDPAAALRLAAATGVTFPLVDDAAAQLREPLRITGLPVTVFVNADGQVSYTQVGPVSSYQQLAALVRQHLGVSV